MLHKLGKKSSPSPYWDACNWISSAVIFKRNFQPWTLAFHVTTHSSYVINFGTYDVNVTNGTKLYSNLLTCFSKFIRFLRTIIFDEILVHELTIYEMYWHFPWLCSGFVVKVQTWCWWNRALLFIIDVL